MHARERATSYHIRLGRPISVIILPVSLLVRTHANASFSTLAALYHTKPEKKRKKIEEEEEEEEKEITFHRDANV